MDYPKAFLCLGLLALFHLPKCSNSKYLLVDLESEKASYGDDGGGDGDGGSYGGGDDGLPPPPSVPPTAAPRGKCPGE